jgi:Tfp pilus assembly PilM family ATPase/Tfp pilus assembly protein PilN
MARTVTGVDIGLRTAKFLRGSWKGNTLRVTGFSVTPLHSREITEGWAAVEVGFKPTNARVGLTGREVNIRYTRAPRVPDWQLRNLMRFEVEEIGEQAGAGVASDFNLLPPLPEIEGEDVVLLAMARESLLDGHLAGLAKVGGVLDAFSPNAVALYNAWLRFGVVGDETVLLANIGHDNVDVAIVRGPDLLFARNLTGGSRLFEDALSQRLGVSSEKAAEIKETLVTLDPGARFTDPNREKASRAVLGAAGQLLSLLQSAVLFCKSQVKVSALKLDRVLLAGGGAALDGLPKYLSAGLSVPVEIFDPWRVIDTSALPADQAAELEDHKLESVAALGLASMACDPQAWSIEILPAKLRKKREFLEGPVWLAAAGVLALLYLGFDAVRTSSRLTDARTRARALEQQVKQVSATHHKAEELTSENARLEKTAELLFEAKGGGEQLARTIAALEHSLPDEFWITQLSSDQRSDPELRIPKGSERPTVSIGGRAREGTTSLSTQFAAFVQGLKKGLPPETALRERPSPNGAKFTVDLTSFAPPEAPAEPIPSKAGPKEASKETPREAPKESSSRGRKAH